MVEKLFAGNNRAAAHAELERILAGGKHPLAECRENAGEYSVWSGPEERVVPPAPPEPEAPPAGMRLRLEDEDVQRIAAEVMRQARASARG